MQSPRLIFLLIALLWTTLSIGQQFARVLPRPAKFDRPEDHYAADRDDNEEMRRWIENEGPNGQDRWVVYSDRKDNVLYDEPDGKPKPRKLGFLDRAFVVEKRGSWLHLIEFQPEITQNGTKIKTGAKIKELGWVHKDNLLLWESALVGPTTNIHRKVVLVNFDWTGNAEGFQGDIGDTIPTYKAPDGRTKGEGTLIYSFFFVLKRQNGYYLLCKSDRFFVTDANTQVIGWVAKQRASQWNTRVALEPNIHKAAFQERKGNPNFQFTHYMDPDLARRHGKTGKRQENLMKVTDPARDGEKESVIPHAMTRNAGYNGERESMELVRFHGGKLRHPILAYEKNDPYFKTSVVGEIGGGLQEDKLVRMEELADKYNSGLRTWNLVFLIEGTKDMLPYRDVLLQSVRNATDYIGGISEEIQIRTSAVIYRDIYEERNGDLIQKIPPTSPRELTQALQNARFYSEEPGDDDYAAYYYGLEKAMEMGAFGEFQINVVIHIGFGGDIRNAPKIRPQDHTAFLTQERLDAIHRKLSASQVSYLSLQLRNKDRRDFHQFVYNGQDLMLRTAQHGHRLHDAFAKKYLQISALANPEMETPDDCGFRDGSACRLELRNGLAPAILYTPGAAKAMGPEKIREEIVHFLERTEEFSRKGREGAMRVLADGQALCGGSMDEEFSKAVIDIIIRHLEKTMTHDEIRSLCAKRFRLMVPSYVPASISGMKHPLSSFIVFMTHKDLSETIDRLEELNAVQNRPQDQIREALFKVISDQCRRLAGEKFNPGKTTMQDFANLLNGLEGEGVVQLPMPEDWRIEDILKSSRVPDGEISAYTFRVASNLEVLRRIHSGDYPFKYSRNNTTYYWIPVEFTL